MTALTLGLANSLSEITLVMFTTIAPASALAYLLILIIFATTCATEEQRRRIRIYLCIPLVLCMSGLIFSTTHLGNPANALYVLTRVGRSPLSNEVFAASVFLSLAALFWLNGFSLKDRRLLDRVLWVALFVTGALFIASVSFAYDVGTIITWSSPYVPPMIALSAPFAGPAIALASLAAACPAVRFRRFERGSALITGVAGLAWVILQVLYRLELDQAGNALFGALELMPFYDAFLVAATCLGVAGFLALMRVLRSGALGRRRILLLAASALCLLGAIFVMRFCFYTVHMTVGVAI